MGKLFVISGRSNTGKDTIYKELLKRMPDLNSIVTYTTRLPRVGEREGIEYHFITNSKLEDLRQKGKVIECRTYNTVTGPLSYCTIDDGQINLNKGNCLVIGTLEQFEQLYKYFGKENVVDIYIEVCDEVVLTRYMEREKKQPNPNYKEICRRFLDDYEEFNEENLARLGILKRFNNEGSLEKVVEEIVNYIRKEGGCYEEKIS